MPKLTWDEVGERFYETGVDHGVLFVMDKNAQYKKGVNWDGLTSVDESPDGAEANDIYADNIKYLSLTSAENFKATINAYQSPEEFDVCDGSASLAKGVTVSQQSRRAFGFSYRSKIGNDVVGDDYGYIIHLVYNAKCAPSQRTRSTTNDSPEAVELGWEVTTTPVTIKANDPETGLPYKPTAHIQINSTLVDADKLASFLDILYGTDGGDPTYDAVQNPTPDSYNEVTPELGANPQALGWYERSGEGTTQDPYVYTLSTDTTVDGEKTYYEKTAGDNPKALGWYEKTGETTYALSNDTSVDESKTYYEKTEDTGTEATLLSPDEVYAHFNSVG